MRFFFCSILLLLFAYSSNSQSLQTPFEHSEGRRCATYSQAIAFFKQLASSSEDVWMEEAGPTDAGIPLHLVYYRRGGKSRSSSTDLIILINNSIHPGEPDGTDACMLLLRDLVQGKATIPEGIKLAIIPVYNIGGALNRGSFSRVNQRGPEAYGFRGNAANLDLNRDFTKNDSREAQSFATLFHRLKPAIFIDNHVSDGADYQHTITLLSTQYDKLGGATGKLMRNELDPAIYKTMAAKGWPMIPYVNFEESDPRKGWVAFYDPPRFSAGYAALFHTIAYTPETHMLKPFKQRVLSTYELMNTIIRESAKQKEKIQLAIATDEANDAQLRELPLSWIADTTAATYHRFMGYEAAYKTSAVTGQPRLYYDHQKPFSATIPIYDHYLPKQFVDVPRAYLIPQGWHEVTDRLALQGVVMEPLARDTFMTVNAYHIADYKTSPKAYESHYKHSEIKVTARREKVRFRKGDLLISTAQPAKRFIVEMLEPTGEDSYFAWNFFDAILQQKEGYSDYRWEDVAADFLTTHPKVRQELEAKKKVDASFAKDASAQLKFVYQHSPWYEPEHLRFPVFRVE